MSSVPSTSGIFDTVQRVRTTKDTAQMAGTSVDSVRMAEAFVDSIDTYSTFRSTKTASMPPVFPVSTSLLGCSNADLLLALSPVLEMNVGN